MSKRTPTFGLAEIEASLAEIGLEKYLARFVADPSIVSPETLATAVEKANEIKALCRMCHLTDEWDRMMNERVSPAKARLQLLKMLAEADEAIVINTVRPTAGNSSHQTKTTTEIMARHNKPRK